MTPPLVGEVVPDGAEPELRRTLSLPLLVFYGVGVTVGAGIFALIGEIVASSGDRAPLAFLVAGGIAGLTGLSYMQLVPRFPRAGGEAVYVKAGLGERFGTVAGLGVVVTGTVSSAVVALAFGGYVGSLVDLEPELGALAIVAVLGFVACLGVRESVMLAAAVTTLEVGTLVVVGVLGLPDAMQLDNLRAVVDDGPLVQPVLAGAVVAFFAFIGFEDIANMAEETVDPERTAPRAIAWTLGVSVSAYVLLALVAVSLPNRTELVASNAPMATVFEAVGGGGGSDVIAIVAALAMTNGILVQIVMAARVLYGMANERLLPAVFDRFGVVHRSRRTPMRATIVVVSAVAGLVVLFPLGRLARITSVITLTVFALVNLALLRILRGSHGRSSRWGRTAALAGLVFSVALAGWEGWTSIGPG